MPLQAIIVNTIFDFPVVENGASTEEIKVNFRTANSWESWGNPHHGFHRETDSTSKEFFFVVKLSRT
jgi:hypothetical protein